MWLQRGVRKFAEPFQERLDFIAQQSLTGFIKAALSFLEWIVAGQNGSDGGKDLRSRRRNQQCGQRTVIETKSVGYRQTLASSSTLRRRDQNLFLHADVPQECGPELSVRTNSTASRVHGGQLEQSIDPLVILGQHLINGARHLVPHFIGSCDRSPLFILKYVVTATDAAGKTPNPMKTKSPGILSHSMNRTAPWFRNSGPLACQ